MDKEAAISRLLALPMVAEWKALPRAQEGPLHVE
jgi:hypothetical protein